MEKKHCTRCGRDLPLEAFYTRRGKQTHSWCKECISANTLERQRTLKRQCVEYKGGRCEVCGGHFHPAVFDFHHMNPDEKDFTLSHVKSLKFSDVIKAELDKCILVCANCHRVIHANY